MEMSASLEAHDIPDLESHRSELESLARACGSDLIALVQGVQERFGFLPRNVLALVAGGAGVSLARLYGVATFYGSFFLAPRGERILRVCTGTACHVGGSHRITEALSDHLGIAPGETSEDRSFTLDNVPCVGCCSLAPVMMVGDRSHGRLDGPSAVGVVRDLREKSEAAA